MADYDAENEGNSSTAATADEANADGEERCSPLITLSLIDADCVALYQAGEGKAMSTDEAVFVRILGTATREYCLALADLYFTKYDKPLSSAIVDEISGHSGRALAHLVTDVPKLVAASLVKAMSGAGTADADLIRLIATQRERHLKAGSAEFHKLYGKTLVETVQAETSGVYRKASRTSPPRHTAPPRTQSGAYSRSDSVAHPGTARNCMARAHLFHTIPSLACARSAASRPSAWRSPWPRSRGHRRRSGGLQIL